MGNPVGFINIPRGVEETRPVKERIKDFKELYIKPTTSIIESQSSRCMDCGVPFCHNGCPLGNVIPDFNDAVYRSEWREAFNILMGTNNFPEFTGRICPAPCEKSCVLGINNDPVAIEFIEKSIMEKAYEEGWVTPISPVRSGKNVAIIGSGPAGLAAAEECNKQGHRVTVYEKNDAIGGLLRYGIPDFKLEKSIIDRRLSIMKASGISFKTNVHVGYNIDANNLLNEYDAIILCCGSSVPRDLKVEGRENKNVHFAMSFLSQVNKYVSSHFELGPSIDVKNKHVVVIGGGDTGADCVGNSNRLGAASVTQLELLSKPFGHRTDKDPWPLWPMTLKTSTSHEEGCERIWSVLTKRFVTDKKDQLEGIALSDVIWGKYDNGHYGFVEVKGTERMLKADVVFLALGFLHPDHDDVVKNLGLTLDERGNVQSDNYKTNKDKIFVAGDMRRGQSLVVWAIAEGRKAAESVHEYLCPNAQSKAEILSLSMQ